MTTPESTNSHDWKDCRIAFCEDCRQLIREAADQSQRVVDALGDINQENVTNENSHQVSDPLFAEPLENRADSSESLEQQIRFHATVQRAPYIPGIHAAHDIVTIELDKLMSLVAQREAEIRGRDTYGHSDPL